MASSRIAANATFALNAALFFILIFVISIPLVCDHFRDETLSYQPVQDLGTSSVVLSREGAGEDIDAVSPLSFNGESY